MKNTNSFRNVFGSVTLSTGANIANAVRGKIEQIGIPESKLPDVDVIFRKALNAQEYTICCRGFGLGHTRMTQAAIAEELHLDPNEVSKIARKAVDKLARAPYKGKILKLVPSLDDLMEAYDKYANLKAAADGLNNQNRGLRKQIDSLKAERDTLAAENAILKDNQAAMAKRLEESEKRADRGSAINAELMDRMEKASTLAVSNFKTNFKKLVAEMEKLAVDEMEKSFKDAFHEVMGDELANYLTGLGISSLGTLTRMSRRNLTGVKVPEKKINEIEERLAQVGLSLRAG